MLRLPALAVRRPLSARRASSSPRSVFGLVRARRDRGRGRLRLSRCRRRRRSSTSAGQREAAGSGRRTTRNATSISLGWLVHAALSLKARLVRLVTRRSSRDAPRRSRRRAPTPRHRRRATAIEPRAERRLDPADDRGRGRRGRGRRGQKPRRSPRKRSSRAASRPRRDAAAIQLPDLALLAAAESRPTSFAPSQDSIQENATSLESVLGDFGVRGEIINARPGPGRHAVRARARARHQVVARDRPRRRHRPLDERAVGARRRRVRPQRHRHRTAERQAREGLLPRNARRPTNTPTRRPSCRSASARPSAASR